MELVNFSCFYGIGYKLNLLDFYDRHYGQVHSFRVAIFIYIFEASAA